jgi:hypothetical protein
VVKPLGSFEWGAVLVGSGVVATIVTLYAIGWEEPAVESVSPARVGVKAAVAKTPAREPAPPARTPAPDPGRSYVLTAARGDSWLLVRERSFGGRVLFEGMLVRGEQVRLRGERVWVRFGAASHLELRIDGQRARLPATGTFDAYVGPRGVRADRRDYATAAQSP